MKMSLILGLVLIALLVGGIADAKTYPLGLNVTPAQMNATSKDISLASSKLTASAYTYPTSWDWRSVKDKNWVTPIEDQKDCGACVAFATVGVGEATLKILGNDSTKNPDLSERFLFEHGGGNCNSGAQFERMLSAFENPGTVNATCAPYYPDTSTCPNWQSDLTKLNSYTTIKTAADAKQWIATKGPVMAGMIVYTDFFDYTGGIYSYQYGDVAGNHAITLIGYNDPGGYWIGKNSWSTEWGDNGYFKIAYGECGIGSDFYFYGETFGATPPPVTQTGAEIDTTGSLKAEIYDSSGKDLGQTDKFLDLTAGTYDVNIKKSGYVDYPLSFTVTQNQTYKTTVTLSVVPPTPQSNITMPVAGKLYSQITYTTSGYNASAVLWVNNKRIGTVAQMKKYRTIYLIGSFAKGTVVNFVLVGEPNTTDIKQIGYSSWSVNMGNNHEQFFITRR